MYVLPTTVLGRGDPFVWAHGLTSSRAHEDQRGLFDWAGLATSGHRVIRYDARGHGEAGGPLDPAAYVWSQLAVDLLALLDRLDIERTAAGGASMGCATVLHAAVTAPDRFERLVLVIPPTAWETRSGQAELYEASATYAAEAGKAAFIDLARQAPQPTVFEGQAPPFDPDIPEHLLTFVLRGAAWSDFPTPDAVAALTQPTLVLAWATDAGHPVSTAARLAELMPNAGLQVAESLADIGTWPRQIADFLA